MSIQSEDAITIPDTPSSVIETLKTGARMNFITAQRERQQIKAKMAKTQLMYEEAQLVRYTELNQILTRHGDPVLLRRGIHDAAKKYETSKRQLDKELEDSMAKIDEILDHYNELV